MKFKNKDKTYITPEGYFKIDDKCNIIGEKRKLKELIDSSSQVRVVHEISPSVAILENVKGDFDLLETSAKVIKETLEKL